MAKKPTGVSKEHIWEDILIAQIVYRVGRPIEMTSKHESNVINAINDIFSESRNTPDELKKSEPAQPGELVIPRLLKMDELAQAETHVYALFTYQRRTRLIEPTIKVRRKFRKDTPVDLAVQFLRHRRTLRWVYAIDGTDRRLHNMYEPEARNHVADGELKNQRNKIDDRIAAVIEVCDKYNNPNLTLGHQLELDMESYLEPEASNEEDPDEDDDDEEC